ncbi:MAG: hypothetical protein IMZ58_12245 [Thermoplasmata archaeon]|nr:hypothetical protein [Thermoplasmata archaeon]
MNVQGWATVITNESTGVGETSAILHGFLAGDGGVLCQYAFDYDTVSGEPYAFSTAWAGAIHSPQEFSQGVALLNEGDLYYFRAKAKNVNGTSVGSEKTFLTLPNNPSNFHAVRDFLVTQINLSWTIGSGANKTFIVRKIGSYPANRLDGVILYNGTSNHYNDGAVVAGTHYYYRAWSYCSEGSLHQFSTNYDEDDCIAMVPTVFDIRDIMVIDNVIPALEITVDVENTGDIITDITMTWVLERADTGIFLDTGSDTFAVLPHSTVTYTIYPITTYVGSVRITFMGASASAFKVFATSSPPTGGGGGFAPPTKPPVVPPILPTILAVTGMELPCLLLILFAIILILLIIIILWKRRKKK